MRNKRKKTRFEKLTENLHKYNKVINDKAHHVYKTPLPKGYLQINDESYDTEHIRYLSISNIGLCLKKDNGEWVKIRLKDIKTLSHTHQQRNKQGTKEEQQRIQQETLH